MLDGELCMIPKIVIVQPQYDSPCEGSVRARYEAVDLRAVGDDRVDVFGQLVSRTSILPVTFNSLLAEALNLRRTADLTHMAMLHADVEPEPGWLTILWRLMRAHRADLVSVVIPIKQPGAGSNEMKTSTAVGRVFDEWAEPIHVRRSDLTGTTFGPEVVCKADEVLLVNTGCFLADVRHPAWDAFAAEGGFNFATRMVRHPLTGTYRAEAQPEDWRMSRTLQAHGARLVATWGVKVKHYGQSIWEN